MLREIDAAEAWRLLENGRVRLVDIREPDEVEAVRVEGAEFIPLSLARHARLAPATGNVPVVFTCRCGRRVRRNAALLEAVAGGPAMNLAGGMIAWQRAGLPVTRGRRVSVQRQAQALAGVLVLGGMGLCAFSHWFILVPVIVGVGLIMAGVTGVCLMAVLLKTLPWNR